MSNTPSSALAPRIACVNQMTVSSCSSVVARYAVSTTCSTFMARSSFRRDDERGDGLLCHLPAIRGRSTPHAVDCLADAALVDAQSAVHPVQVRAALARVRHQRRDPVLAQRMILLRGVAAVHGIRVL